MHKNKEGRGRREKGYLTHWAFPNILNLQKVKLWIQSNLEWMDWRVYWLNILDYDSMQLLKWFIFISHTHTTHKKNSEGNGPELVYLLNNVIRELDSLSTSSSAIFSVSIVLRATKWLPDPLVAFTYSK